MAATCVDLAAQLAAIDAELAALGPELVPERVPGHALAGVVKALGRIKRRAGGAQLVLTKAAADAGAWKPSGCRSPEEWAAKANGTSLGEARGDLKASERLAGLAATRDAVGSGELSAEKARAVAEGASADPAAEGSLLEKARRGDLADVRDEARRVRQRADEASGRAALRMYQRRGLRAWVEVDGEGRGSWNVPPGFQAVFLAALEPYRAEAFRLARESGRRETPEALMADALHMLCRDVLADHHLPIPDDDACATDGGGQVRGDDSDTGPERPDPGRPGQHAAPSSATATAHQGPQDGVEQPAGGPGGEDANPTPRHGPQDGLFDPAPSAAANPGPNATGPAPSPSANDPSGPGGAPRFAARPRGAGNRRAPAQVIVRVDHTALVRGHTVDGETCEIVGLGPIPVSLARYLAQDSVLRVLLTGADDVTVITSERRYIPAPLRAAVEARDTTCVVPGCHARHHLEIDHVHTPFAQGGATKLANLARLCRYHHALKTYCGWILAGRPGQWTFQPP
ncbi:hypothetical protein [Iamia sp.]|uniref:hypothetical protein n=1 Tax=Iamia sp. TaxID=2722710 RepID=UPI002CD49C2A|nr:hypothetical protein [Iamia sp.]HXH57408.1 hypothetical protein [Iamia sp.]